MLSGLLTAPSCPYVLSVKCATIRGPIPTFAQLPSSYKIEQVGETDSTMSPPLSPPFGVVYSPESIQEYKAPSVQTLKKNGVKYIRVTWLDYSSTIRYHVVPVNHFERMLKSARPGITLPRTVLSTVGQSSPEGY